MAKFCEMCDEKMGLLARGNICKTCFPNYDEWAQLKNNISTLQTLSDQQLTVLQKFGKNPLEKLYTALYTEFESDQELDENELDTLDKIQTSFALTTDDVKYNDRVLPYVYVNEFKRLGALPTMSLDQVLGTPLVLKKGEVVHYASRATLDELRSVSLGYQGGSRGVSIRIAKGVTYRVGSHRGHIVKEDRLVKTSEGVLIVTNKRLFLIPEQGKKPVTIPINKIHFYRCSENGLELYKDGREKGYFFSMGFGAVEIFGICLGELTQEE